jgi:hypothetical protein
MQIPVQLLDVNKVGAPCERSEHTKNKERGGKGKGGVGWVE